jgi:hypothetical protein
MTQAPLGEWLPDLPEHNNPGTLVAKNCIPQLVSYRSLRDLQSFTNALDGPCLGAAWIRDSNNVVSNFAGDMTKLYRLTSGTWNDVSDAGGYNSVNWQFAQFGDFILATNISNNLQIFNLLTGTNFRDTAGSPPRAARIAVVRDFVVLGDIDDGVRRPDTVRWSAFNNAEDYEQSQITQSGSQSLRGQGGEVRQIIGGEEGTIWHENSITRMRYIGPPFIFRFDRIERSRGTAAPMSVVSNGAIAFFYAHDGFYSIALSGQQGASPIGHNRVNRWFLNEVETSEIINMRGALDRENNLAMWAFKTSGSLDNNDRLLIYNYQSDKWGYAVIETQVISEFVSQNLTLDELDPVLPGGIDVNDFSVDSTSFIGGSFRVIGFDGQNRAATFSGENLPMCIDTKEYSQDDTFMFITDVRPLVEADGDVNVTPIVRDRIIDTPVTLSPALMNDLGICDVRLRSKYVRFRLTTQADVRHANAIEFTPKARGRKR